MRKKLLAILLMIFIVSSSVICQAAPTSLYEEYAVKLSAINVFKGTGNGFELERQPNRLEGLVMLIRLLGKESAADALKTSTCNFTDVPDWGRGYVNYAYANGLTNGVGDKIFGSNDIMDANSYVTFLLRALGYSDNPSVADFNWSTSKDFAKQIGLIDSDMYTQLNSNKFIRSYVAKLSYDALKSKMKNDTKTLIQKLVADGVISEAVAKELDTVPTAPVSTVNKVLTTEEIGELAEAVVMIEVTDFRNHGGGGSGFYVSSDGHIITNYHVIEGAISIVIVENDGTKYTGEVRVIGYDKEKDIAILDINKTVGKYLELGNSDETKLGEDIYTIGSPLGLQNTLSTGIISGKREGFIQISAPISPGSSGGALINKYGKVIGITTMIYVGGENLGFAIPINMYKDVKQNLQLTLLEFSAEYLKNDKPDKIPDNILNKYFEITYQGKTAYIDEINVVEYSDGTVFVDLCLLTPDSAISFLELIQINGAPKYVEDYCASFLADANNYYNNKDIQVTIIFMGYFTEYPEAFEENALFDETIIYDKEYDEWFVRFPFFIINENGAFWWAD